MTHLIPAHIAQALAWTLIHSLWEAALIAVILALILRILRAPTARYASACLAMLAILVSFALTFFLVLPPAATVTAPIPLPGLHGSTDAPSTTVPARLNLAAALPWLTPLWFAGVIIFHLRSLASWFAARRLVHHGVCQPPHPWQQRLDQLRAAICLAKPVTLLETCLADVPAVIGHLRPVILVPVGLLTGMPPAQVEAILLHELAHIRRRDYLVNMLQMLAESSLFYHPAVWWISSVIRAERENCCDDLAVAHSGDAGEYATALLYLEQTRGFVNQAALAASGGNLMQRIRRLLDPVERPRFAFMPAVSAGVLTLAAVVTLVAWQTPQAPPVDSPYTKWVKEDVAYIITDRERTAFLGLIDDKEREMFITQFWDRRNPTPGAATNPFKEENYRRLAYANDHFANWKTDRARIYITFGPPDEVEIHVTPFPKQQWLYHLIPNVGTNVIIEFDDKNNTGDFRMTSDPNPPKSAAPPAILLLVP